MTPVQGKRHRTSATISYYALCPWHARFLTLLDPVLIPEDMTQRLRTPPVACIVPEGVFDAFGWCESDVLEWRTPDPMDRATAVTATNPAQMAFVMKSPCDFLPRELARLHVPGLGLDEQWALAPYAIDDAVDELYLRGALPAASSGLLQAP
jgi:hypothetical protein